jgi:hypothetical protein
MLGHKKEIIYDSDGSLSVNFDNNTRVSSTIVHNWKHIQMESACLPSSNPSKWDNALSCDQTVTIRRVMFTNLINDFIFDKAPIKVQLLSSYN